MSCDVSQGRVSASERLYSRAVELIPGGTQTNSKKAPAGTEGYYPRFIARGEGPYVWDLDGNRYIDHKLGCGPVILGHAYPEVNEAAARQLRDGLAYPSCHPSEVTLAELLVEVIPCAEMTRFLKSGAEGTAAAARLARAYTGRELLVSSGYHGWHDWGMAKSPSAEGIPACVRELTLDLPYGDYERLETIFRDAGERVAALVFSAPYHDSRENIAAFLRRARELTQVHGALLVYDEIVTGFRVALGGLGEYSGVQPDLAVFSKGIANGFPIAAVTGSRAVMGIWDRAVISSTFGGEAVSIVAAIACIGVHMEHRVTDAVAARGAWFKREAERLGRELGFAIAAVGFDALPVLTFPGETGERQLALHRGLLSNGVLPYFPMWYISYSHSHSVMEGTLAALRQALLATGG